MIKQVLVVGLAALFLAGCWKSADDITTRLPVVNPYSGIKDFEDHCKDVGGVFTADVEANEYTCTRGSAIYFRLEKQGEMLTYKF
jgi:hypothetical protein